MLGRYRIFPPQKWSAMGHDRHRRRRAQTPAPPVAAGPIRTLWSVVLVLGVLLIVAVTRMTALFEMNGVLPKKHNNMVALNTRERPLTSIAPGTG